MSFEARWYRCTFGFEKQIVMAEKDGDRSYWAVGGSTMIGVGVGLMYLRTDVMIFVGCILIGVGAGLVLEQALAKR